MTQVELGKLIAKLRHDKGLTQQKFADLLGVSNKTVSRWERGNGVPDVTLLPTIASIFGITVDELLDTGVCHDVSSPNDEAGSTCAKSIYAYSAFSMLFSVISIVLLCSLVFALDYIIGGIVVFLVLWIVGCGLALKEFLLCRDMGCDGDISRSVHALLRVSFLAIIVILWTLVLSLPILCTCVKAFDYNTGEYVFQVLSVYEYYDWLICICLVFPYLLLRYYEFYASIVIHGRVLHDNTIDRKKIVLSDSLLISAGVLFFLYPMIGVRYLDTILLCLGGIYLAGSLVIDILLLRHKESIFYAIRNALLIIPISFAYRMVDVVREGSTLIYSLAANYPLWVISGMLEILLITRAVYEIMNRR